MRTDKGQKCILFKRSLRDLEGRKNWGNFAVIHHLYSLARPGHSFFQKPVFTSLQTIICKSAQWYFQGSSILTQSLMLLLQRYSACSKLYWALKCKHPHASEQGTRDVSVKLSYITLYNIIHVHYDSWRFLTNKGDAKPKSSAVGPWSSFLQLLKAWQPVRLQGQRGTVARKTKAAYQIRIQYTDIRKHMDVCLIRLFKQILAQSATILVLLIATKNAEFIPWQRFRSVERPCLQPGGEDPNAQYEAIRWIWSYFSSDQ